MKQYIKAVQLLSVQILACAAIFVVLFLVLSPPVYAEGETIIVETGNAAAVAQTNNDENVNNIETEENAAISVENSAETVNDTGAEALSGGNTAQNKDGGASIETGSAYASATAINVINTNIIDSSGILMFEDFFASLGFDLRALDLSYFFDTSTSTGSDCSLCEESLSITADNNATTTNEVIARASTGDNTALGGEGDASISTGNAYASANAVNLINSNIIRSNYLLVGLNGFGDVQGDFVLPGASFFEHLLARNRDLSGQASISASNTAEVTNSTSVIANTGNNSATSEGGESAVDSGDALSSATTYNQVNANYIGGTTMFFLFRIWGNWSGTVHGLPEGMSWQETPFGIELTNTGGSMTNTEDLLTSTCCGENSLSATTTNNALLRNNVSAFALTGDNRAGGARGSAEIHTGNAYASANTVNIINTNLVGHNWLFAIFNIFGSLDGDIAFGRPNLWLGITAEASNPTKPGSPVTFHFTVANMGDANATQVRLSADFLKPYLIFNEGEETNSGLSWLLGDISRGETREFTYAARAGDVPQDNSVVVPLTANVTSDETDENDADNTDALTVVILNPRITGGGSQGETFTSDPKFRVIKTANINITTVPVSVDYTITITNDGGPAHNVVATDVLKGSDGHTMKTQTWNLDTIAYNEELQITYTAQFGSALAPGSYTNTMTLSGTQNYKNPMFSSTFAPISATHSLLVLPSGRVLGTTTCEAYLTSYMKPGNENDRNEVEKLQHFFNEQGGFDKIPVTGIYDAATTAVVKAFQHKYAESILAPWGYLHPTGSVYYTTQKMVNNINCGGLRSFGLTLSQTTEIDRVRRLLADVSARPTNEESMSPLPLPPAIEVGESPSDEPQQAAKTWSWLDFFNPL